MSIDNKRNPELHKKLLLEALERNLGVVTPSCKEVGISRNLYYNYYANDPEFKKAVDEINTVAIDYVESQLFNKIKEGSEKSILFFMKYRGKKRGYTDSIEIEGNIDHTIKIIKLIGPKSDDNEDFFGLD